MKGKFYYLYTEHPYLGSYYLQFTLTTHIGTPQRKEQVLKTSSINLAFRYGPCPNTPPISKSLNGP